MLKYFHQYNGLLIDIMNDGIVELNKRTNTKIKVLEGGIALKLDLSNNQLPVTGTRKLFPRSAAAEAAWFVEGTQDVGFIKKYAPLWDKFVEADGKTIEAAYGYRWQKHFGRNQLKDAINALKKDPSNRRVYLSAWDPASDGLLMEGQKNVPCPTSFSLNVINDALHCSLFLRSSDVFVGLPYDIMGQSLLLKAIAQELNLKLGSLHVTLAHAHLYECHWAHANTCIDAYNNCKYIITEIEMPDHSISDVEKDLDKYVKHVSDLAKAANWIDFNPKPFVVE